MESPDNPDAGAEDYSKENSSIAAAELGATEKPLESTSAPIQQTTTVDGYPGGVRLVTTFLALMLCLLLGGLDANIIATAVPSITDHFHTVADVGWYYTAYRLSSCSVQFVFGKLYKLYSTKRLFIVSNVIFLCGSLLCALATASSMLVVGRAVTGVGLAGGAAGFFNLLMEIVPPRKRPFYGSIFGAVESLSAIVAPSLGGVITQQLSWRWCFWINLPIGGVGLLAIAFLLPESKKVGNNNRRDWRETIRELDIIGNVLFISCVTALLIAFNYAGIVYAWNDPRIIALFVVFAVLLGALTIQQIFKGESGILPIRVIRNRNILGGLIFSICSASALNIFEYYAPTYFQAVKGYSPTRSGYMMFPCLLGTVVGFLVQGVGTSRLGYYTPFMLASSILLPIASGLLTTWNATTGLAQLIVYFALIGFAAGIGFQCPQNSAQTALPKDDVPLGLAVVLFAQSFGPALFVSIAQTIFTNRLPDNVHQLAPSVNATRIEDIGLTEVKTALSGQALGRVTLAFSNSISQSWFLALGLACVAMTGAVMTEWLSVKEDDS